MSKSLASQTKIMLKCIIMETFTQPITQSVRSYNNYKIRTRITSLRKASIRELRCHLTQKGTNGVIASNGVLSFYNACYYYFYYLQLTDISYWNTDHADQPRIEQNALHIEFIYNVGYSSSCSKNPTIICFYFRG